MNTIIEEPKKFAECLINGSVCRLCLTYNTTQKYNKIFTDEYKLNLYELCSVDLNVKDQFPRSICQECASKVDSFIQFRRSCQTTNEMLQRLCIACDNLNNDNFTSKIDLIVKVLNELQAKEATVKIELSPDDSFTSDNEHVSSFIKSESCSDDNLNLEMLRISRKRKTKNVKKLKKVAKKTSRKASQLKTPASARPDVAMIEGLVPEITEEIMKLKDTNYVQYKKEIEKRICPVCNNVYRSNYFVNSHYRRVHLKLKPYMCDVCARSFSERNGLDKHMRVHADMNKFKCKECEFTARLAQDLQRHMTIHNNVNRPHICPICSMSFRHRAHKSRHLKLHSTPYPYECQECDKKFREKRSYNNHYSLIHRGIKRYQCKYCPMRFGYDMSMRHHCKVAHGIQGNSGNYSTAAQEQQSSAVKNKSD